MNPGKMLPTEAGVSPMKAREESWGNNEEFNEVANCSKPFCFSERDIPDLEDLESPDIPELLLESAFSSSPLFFLLNLC